MGETMIRENLLLGLGNPLLDISANAEDDLLEKYGLKNNDAILAEEKHKPMYSEMVEKYKVEYTVGGACQNSMRTFQWILNTKNVASFMGCIGKDKFGEILEAKAKEAGVNVHYQYHDTEPTGTCAVVITNNGANRSLCANLAAANYFAKSHLDKKENRNLIEEAQFYYITSFFLTVSPESIMEVAHHACEHNKVFTMNLSAPFLSQFFKKPMMEAMPYVDILFGNEEEAVTFSREQDLKTENIAEIALKICDLPKKNNKKARLVIITQAKDPVIVAQNGQIKEYPATVVNNENIIDTNGAGDAFVGGFFAMYIQGKPLEECIRCAIYTATEVIQQSGCTLPEQCAFKY